MSTNFFSSSAWLTVTISLYIIYIFILYDVDTCIWTEDWSEVCGVSSPQFLVLFKYREKGLNWTPTQTSSNPVQCSTSWDIRPAGSWSLRGLKMTKDWDTMLVSEDDIFPKENWKLTSQCSQNGKFCIDILEIISKIKSSVTKVSSYNKSIIIILCCTQPTPWQISLLLMLFI